MTVKKYHLDGNYVINRNLFKGPNTDWQYEHYRLSIKNDTLVLIVMNNGKIIKTYEKPISYTTKGKHTFFCFSKATRFPRIKHVFPFDMKDAVENFINENCQDSMVSSAYEYKLQKEFSKRINDSIYKVTMDSIDKFPGHHMLKFNPVLHADPFSFNIVLRSTRYRNMFFVKED
ncbi:MAG: hypothetical protein AAF611_00915 [Bacteroidota bacterium]